MKYIQLLTNSNNVDFAGDMAVDQLFDGPYRRIVDIRIKNGGTLARHHAAEPITVYCVAGTGTFTAGPDLEDTQELASGTLITLEAGVEHEVKAEQELHLLVSKFKGN